VIRAARDCKADLVYWNRDYEPGAIERDRLVHQQLGKLAIAARTFKDHVVFEADEVRGGTGEPLQRYSAYRARWWAKWQTSKPVALPVPKAIKSPRPLSSKEQGRYVTLAAFIPHPSWIIARPVRNTWIPGNNR
jgi:deoxyribodipyrimidine photo-lyase